MKASLIIAVYKRDDFLRLVFGSIQRQTFRNFEVIVAEDDKSAQIAELVAQFKDSTEVPVHHVRQADEGFCKNRILNRAVARACGEYLVFIDGDCILHRKFLQEYMRRARSGICLFGRRVMLGEDITRKLIERKTVGSVSFISILKSRSKHKEEGLYLPFLRSSRKTGIRGCNFCVGRGDLLAVNGFDEDFTEPYYGEDTDVARRLQLHGVILRCTRYATIQYHLHHDSGNRQRAWDASEKLYRMKSADHNPRCVNGIVKLDQAVAAEATPSL